MNLQAIKNIENMVNLNASMQFMTLKLLSGVGELAKKIELSAPCSDEIGNVLTCIVSIVKIRSDLSLCRMIEKITKQQVYFSEDIELHQALSMFFKQVGQWSDNGFPLVDRYNLLEQVIYDLMYIANIHGYQLLDCLNTQNNCEVSSDL